MGENHYIACDLGAESGRVILGSLAGNRLTFEEVHRFPTGAVRLGGSLRWNLLRIFEEIKRGLKRVASRGLPVRAVSVDSWGVDYALFNSREPLLCPPHHYRDPRTAGPYESAASGDGRELIFAETGIQFMSINTLYHLIAEVEQNAGLLELAERFLNIADYVNYLLSGVARAEVSLASTTQVFNPVAGDWSNALIERFGLPGTIFPEIVPSCTQLGPLTQQLQADTGLGGVEVVATCSHDTGAAVAAVPGEGADWAYLSSGTWSLIGVELPRPLINDQVLAHNFTNEAGACSTTRLLKNISGLWLLQECRRAWASAGEEHTYEDLSRMAEKAEPFRSIVDPNDSRFLAPDDMPAEIASACRESGQPEPESHGQFARCVLESLALSYHKALGVLEQLTARKIAVLHIVGGGSQSGLLNQLTADLTGRKVLAGPVEATAIGNLLLQAMALGEIDSLGDLRRVVRDSFPLQTYQPQPAGQWQQARQRFAQWEPAS